MEDHDIDTTFIAKHYDATVDELFRWISMLSHLVVGVNNKANGSGTWFHIYGLEELLCRIQKAWFIADGYFNGENKTEDRLIEWEDETNG